MNKQDIIKELDIVIAMCEETKNKAAGLRKKLAPFKVPAPGRGKKKEMSTVIAHAILKRNKRLRAV